MTLSIPSWRNTLQRTEPMGHFVNHVETALNLGYTYVLWNGRVYRAYTDNHGNATAEDIDLTIGDLK